MQIQVPSAITADSQAASCDVQVDGEAQSEVGVQRQKGLRIASDMSGVHCPPAKEFVQAQHTPRRRNHARSKVMLARVTNAANCLAWESRSAIEAQHLSANLSPLPAALEAGLIALYRPVKALRRKPGDGETLLVAYTALCSQALYQYRILAHGSTDMPHDRHSCKVGGSIRVQWVNYATQPGGSQQASR